MTSPLKAALRYEALGLAALPMHQVTEGRCSCGCAAPECSSRGKHPRVNWTKHQSKRPSPEQLTKWWKQWPRANVGIVTGAISGLFVVDIDGEAGWEALAGTGIDLRSMRTPTVITSRGKHLYFKHPGDGTIPTKAGFLPKVDIRADGGLVVAPPSVHKNGDVYTWEEELGLDEVELAEIDLVWPASQGTQTGAARGRDWLLSGGDNVDPRIRTAASVALDEIAGAEKGDHHGYGLKATARLAGFVNKNLADEDALWLKVLAAWHASGEDNDGELERMWRGALKKKFGDTRTVISEGKVSVTHAIALRLQDRGHRWLDTPYDWQHYNGSRWAGLTTAGVATVAYRLYAELGEKPTSHQVDEVVKIAQRGVCAAQPRPRAAVLDGRAFRLRDNEPVPGVLFDDVRVEVLPDGDLKPHRHSREVFTPQPPLPLAWGDGAMAPTPLWDELCGRFRLEGNRESLNPELVLRYVGAALAGDASHHKFLCLHGAAAGGKTVLINVLRGLLTPSTTFDPRDQWALAGIERARLATADDVTVTDNGILPWGWERVKGLTGDSAVHVQIKHRPSYTARFRGLFVMASNAKPEFAMNKDAAAWRRRAIYLAARPFEGERIDSLHEMILEREGEALARRALHAYAAQVVAGGGWGHLEKQRRAGLRSSREPIGIRNTKAEIRRILRVHPGLQSAEIYERIPHARRATKKAVYKKLSELRDAGKIERDEERRYRLPETGSG